MARMTRVPQAERDIADALSALFRGGDIYAYSYDPQAKGWSVWRTEADWLATERNGKVRRPELAAAGHGPHDMTGADARAFCGLAPKRTRKRRKAPAAQTGEHADRLAALAAAVSSHRDPAAALGVLEAVAAGWEVSA